MKYLFILASVIISSAASVLSAQIAVQIDYHYYPVTVQNQANINSATEAGKPTALAGSPKPSRTIWRIDYSFNSVRKYGNNCQVSTYDIKVACAITLPDYKSNDQVLAYRLKSYAELLKAHELKHCEIVKEHADKFEKWLNSIRYYSCGEVMNSVRRQYDIFMQACEWANIKYDRATDYGKKDGADLDLLLPKLENEPGGDQTDGRETVEDRSGLAIEHNEQDVKWEPKMSEEGPQEPMSNYYKDKDGVWRNDAR